MLSGEFKPLCVSDKSQMRRRRNFLRRAIAAPRKHATLTLLSLKYDIWFPKWQHCTTLGTNQRKGFTNKKLIFLKLWLTILNRENQSTKLTRTYLKCYGKQPAFDTFSDSIVTSPLYPHRQAVSFYVTKIVSSLVLDPASKIFYGGRLILLLLPVIIPHRQTVRFCLTKMCVIPCA